MEFKNILTSFALALAIAVPSVSSAMTSDQMKNSLGILNAMLDISKSFDNRGEISSLIAPKPLTSSYVSWTDVDSDKDLDRSDLDFIYNRIGSTSADVGYSDADINNDGTVDKEDFYQLRNHLHSIGDYVSAYDGSTIGPGWTVVPADGVIDQNDVNAMGFAVGLHAKDPVLYYSLYYDLNEDGKIDKTDLNLYKNLLLRPPEIEEPVPLPKEPVVEISFPQGQLAVGTTKDNLIIKTDLPSVCSYSQNPKDTYSQMKAFFVSGAGTDKNISFQPLSDLPQNKEINYYVKCKSLEGVVMDSNYLISFSVGEEYSSSNQPSTAPLVNNLTFSKTPNDRAVINTGGEGLPTTAWDPYIHVDDEGYHIFYTSLFCKEKEGDDYNFSFHPGNQRTCNIADNFGSIAYGFSDDKGLTWELHDRPVIYGGGNTGWDDHAIETAHVTRIGDKLHLFYSGTSMEMQSRYQIGKGELDLVDDSIYKTIMTEGKTFTRPAEPFLARQDKVSDFDNNVQEPSVVVKDDQIELFWIGLRWKFPGEAESYPGQAIRGIGMFRTVYDLDFNLIEQTESSIADNVNITEVKYFEGQYYMFFTTLETSGEFHKDEKVGLMTSNDGLSWGNRRIIVTKGPSDSYDGWGMFAPTVVQDGKDLVMFVTTLSVEDGKPDIANLKPGERVGIGLENETVYGGIGRLKAEFIK